MDDDTGDVTTSHNAASEGGSCSAVVAAAPNKRGSSDDGRADVDIQQQRTAKIRARMLAEKGERDAKWALRSTERFMTHVRKENSGGACRDHYPVRVDDMLLYPNRLRKYI